MGSSGGPKAKRLCIRGQRLCFCIYLHPAQAMVTAHMSFINEVCITWKVGWLAC